MYKYMYEIAVFSIIQSSFFALLMILFFPYWSTN